MSPSIWAAFRPAFIAKAYQDLIDYLGYDESIQILDPVQQLVVPSERVLELFHVDMRYVTAHGPDSFPGRHRAE